MKEIRWACRLFFVIACLAFSSAAWAQTNGEIRGSVKDPSGAVLPGASITATFVDTGATRAATTGSDGEFDIPELPVGTYSITAEAQGFKKFVAKDIVVSIGHVAAVTITLEIGGAEQTVTVEGNAVQVETTSTQLGATMTDQSIRELPLNTRNAYQLLQLQPGVQSQLGADLFYGSSNAGVVSVNGGRGRSNNYTVNGGDGNDIFVNAPAIEPSPDAIEEFRVLTNTFDAEYGRNSGSVVNVVTKSGTNQVHGDFYEFVRNQALNTRGYFDPFLLPYSQNQFGGTIGGPIKKDKTFIFGSYEGNRNTQGFSTGTVLLPTLAEANTGDFSGGVGTPGSPANFGGTLNDAPYASNIAARPGCLPALTPAGAAALSAAASGTPQPYSAIFPNSVIPTKCFDPTAQALYSLYVAPFQAQANPATGALLAASNLTEHDNQFTVRLDHNFSSAQKLTVYYYFQESDNTQPFSNFQAAGANVPGFGAIFKTRTQQVNLSHTWTIGPTKINEFHFNYFREGQRSLNHPVNILPSVHDSCGNLVPAANCFSDPMNLPAGITTDIPGREGVPFVNVSGGFVIGNNFEGELPQAGNTFQWADNFTLIKGNHTIKFGGDVRYQQFNQFLYFNINGDYTFNSSTNNDVRGTQSNLMEPTDLYPDYFLGTPSTYSQGAAQAEDIRNKAVYLFAQDSWKIKPSLTLNYGLRWELNTPYYDLGNRLQTYRPGQVTTKYSCVLNTNNQVSLNLIAAAGGSDDCGPNGPANSVFPLGLVFPGDPGVPQGLTSTYYKSFAPRIGIAWSPGATEGWIAKITGGPGNMSIRAGWGLFYNPIEQLVLEQFSAEPPFGGSAFISNAGFNTPFLTQGGTQFPNVFQGVINQTPNTPCFKPGGPNGCVDFSQFRPLLLFGEFDPHLRSQYAAQYNLTIERQITKSMVFRVSYVGTQAHRLLASHDENAGNINTCLELIQISTINPANLLSAPGPGAAQTNCGPFGSDSQYFIAPGTVIPPLANVAVTQPFKVVPTTCTGLVLPYNAGAGGNCVAAGTVVGPNGISLVGTRPFSSPQCQPLSGSNMTGCPIDGVPVFSNIFAEGTIAASNYNGLQVSLDRSYSHGLLFSASYTYSKAIDQGASFENELNPLNFNATRGLSLLDAKNRFVFSPVWTFPVPQFSGFKGKALDGWGASAIITYQTGFPIRLQTQDDTELQSSFFFEVANTPQSTGPVRFTNPKLPGNIFFDSSNINDPPPGVYGNLPHALCCGPTLSNTDLVINKKTPITERWNTEFRAEFYNLFNHTQFANPDGNFSDLAPPSGTFGTVLKTREGPRVIQFGIKIMF
jgi:hypothetical protein